MILSIANLHTFGRAKGVLFMMHKRERLITQSYCFILIANFLLHFAFYLLLPILPFYLLEVFGSEEGAVGIILSLYTVAALTIRPFSGYLLDTFARKPLYLLSYVVFTAVFGGYMLAGTITVFIVMRVVHGVSFGMVTVAGNTLVIDIMPSSRRGEGLGYYGLANNIAMAVGPMTGLLLYDHYSFNVIFITAFIACLLGCLIAVIIKVPEKCTEATISSLPTGTDMEIVKREPLSLDRFILLKGIPAGLTLLLLSIPYGMMATYIAVYARDIGITRGTGLFFTLMAIGMASSRIFSGKQVDRGYVTRLIAIGMVIVGVCFFTLSLCSYIMTIYPLVGGYIFFGAALFMGIGFGTMFPAYNALFINLAPNNKRGTATSTYLISWDIGIGIGLVTGGYIAQESSLRDAYFLGGCLVAISVVLLLVKAAPHFNKNKLR